MEGVPIDVATARAVAAARTCRLVVLVEGTSDEAALHAAASRCALDLAGHEVGVVAIGGATNVGRVVAAVRSVSPVPALAGLYDSAEERWFARALLGEDVARALGYEHGHRREALAQSGFLACEPDLEGELIRALGVPAVLGVVDAEGELASFERLRRQPAQRPRTIEEQLHRFLGTRARRKVRYAALLVEALDPDALPAPLTGVLDVVRRVATPPR